MAGIYIHIPYCMKACTYCDFHFSTSLKSKDKLLEAIVSEIKIRNKEINGYISSIYFGGGTPSILNIEEIDRIISCIKNNYNIKSNVEVTIEANPEDINLKYLSSLFLLGVNRLSIGIQSLNDDVLEWMNRAHNSSDALSSVKTAKKAGFNNISIDLIYGVPHKFNRDWQAELELIKDINIQHISAYSLTVEKKTALDYQIKKGLIEMLDDDGFSSEYEIMRNSLLEDNFMQYEVSNFCKQGFESKHNSSYWKSIPYLGIGPSAHSYDEKSRRWNVSNNNKYIVGVLSNKLNFQTEVLSNIDIANEIILTGTRTIYGFSKDKIINLLNNNQIDSFLSQVDKLIANNYLTKHNDIIKVNLKQNFLSDYIARELFVV